MADILIVDDDPGVRSALSTLVARQGHTVTQAVDGVMGAARLRERRFDLAITDMQMPAGDGFTVLEAGLAAQVPVVILTGHATVQLAVEAMKRGAADFLSKPFTFDTVATLLRDLLGARGNGRPSSFQKPIAPAASGGPVAVPPNLPDVDKNSSFRGVLDIIDRVADTDATILITGETGTGKEVVARAIHNASLRRDKQFVPVNCGAIPEALLESELFGHVKGAFTGATSARRGRFQLAEGGTLFLDEIGDMPMPLQVKLLRVIQERRFEVLGDSSAQPANVRFIAATHRDLPEYVRKEKFREDLFYRLNVVPLHLPALRERKRDIPLLIEHFIGEANAAHGRTVSGVDDEALIVLGNYAWPGNIRELANVIERMVLLRGGGPLQLDDIPANIQGAVGRGEMPADEELEVDTARGRVAVAVHLPEGGIALSDAVHEVEGRLIQQALARTHGNRSQAAALLRINRTTLIEKLRRREPTES